MMMETQWCLALFFLMVAFSVSFHGFVCSIFKLKTWKHLKGVRRALLVTAHPDDECMFFGPVIVHLTRERCDVFLLCLSIGDYYKLGKKRKEELRTSCKILGIPEDNITIVQHSQMPDDPKKVWREDLVGSIMLKYIESMSIDLVITFDQSGVSGHLNHISVYDGIVHLLKKNLLGAECRVCVLESVNKIRKYSSFLDLPFSFFWSDYIYVLPWNLIFLVKRAMYAHSSQMLWFRHLYSMFSRYMIMNTLYQIRVEADKDD